MTARREGVEVRKTEGFWLEVAADGEALKRSFKCSISKIAQSIWKQKTEDTAELSIQADTPEGIIGTGKP